MGGTNQIFWIDEIIGIISDVFYSNWIHVVDVDSPMNLITFKTEITTEITSDDEVTNRSPFIGMVELLIQIPVKPKCLFTDLPIKLEILIPS
jgi:hypothetical protein